MADSFFGFDTALPSHDDDGDFEGGEEEYDALNDETFGADDTFEEDWEKSHEKLAEITESARVHRNSFNESSHHANSEDEEDGLGSAQLEASLNRMVLDDLDPLSPIKSKPATNFPSTLPQVPWPNTPPQHHPHLNGNSQQANQISAFTIISQMAAFPPPQIQSKGPATVKTVEELERDLRKSREQQLNNQIALQNVSDVFRLQQVQQQQQQQQQIPQRVPSVRTVEELERDLRQQQQQRRPEKPDGILPEQGFGPVVSRGDNKQPLSPSHRNNNLQQQQQGMQGPAGLAELINAAAAGVFPRPPHLSGRPPPRFLPPNNKTQFSHPPPNAPGMLPLPPPPFRAFPPPRIPPPPLMSHPPPNFPPRMHLHNRNDFPFPWMHQPPPLHPPHNIHHEQQRVQQAQQQMQHRHQNGIHDPYAGLMSGKDKQWLINIQILQLNSQKPYVDDFYYTAFQLKQQLARERAGEKGVKVLRREQRTLEPRAYTPAQFEGSLGKLQVVSVTAPRKIIDMDLVSSEPSELDKPTRDSRRIKQTLLELERLYLLVLQLEDLAHPLPEARASVQESKEELVAKVLATLNCNAIDDKLPSFLCVRKGKTLLQRIIPHLTWSQQSPVWRSVMRSFWSISRRDNQDQILPELFPIYKDWNSNAVLPSLLALANAMLPQVPTDRTSSPISIAARNPLPAAITNKFGVSVIAAMINKASDLSHNNTPPPTHPEWKDWSNFISILAEVASEVPSDLCTPIEPLRTPATHLVHLETKPGLALQRALGVDSKILTAQT